MDSSQKVVVNRSNKPMVKPKQLTSPTQNPSVQQPEQPDPVEYLKSLVEHPPGMNRSMAVAGVLLN